jgi:hypothetical protein
VASSDVTFCALYHRTKFSSTCALRNPIGQPFPRLIVFSLTRALSTTPTSRLFPHPGPFCEHLGERAAPRRLPPCAPPLCRVNAGTTVLGSAHRQLCAPEGVCYSTSGSSDSTPISVGDRSTSPDISPRDPQLPSPPNLAPNLDSALSIKRKCFFDRQPRSTGSSRNCDANQKNQLSHAEKDAHKSRCRGC